MTRPQGKTKAPRRRPKVVIGEECLKHLEALAEGAYQRTPELADFLLDELARARIVPDKKLPKNVVTIGRQVTYMDEFTGERINVTPVYPEDADITRGFISILTPIGVALIGLVEGASLPWQTRGGEMRTLKVLNVSDAPETDTRET